MLTLILARALDDTIGDGNTLPWSIKSDLSHFKKRTMGKHLVMGRRTYDSLPKSKLPGREKIVLSRDLEFSPEDKDTHVYRDYRDIVHLAEVMDLFIIGGAQIYDLFLPYATSIEETHVHASPNGDVKWGKHVGHDDWARISSKDGPFQDEGDQYPYEILKYTKVTQMDDEDMMTMFIQEEMAKRQERQ